MEKSEIKNLLGAFEGRYRLRNHAMVQTGLYTGLRLGSVLSLKVGDIWDGKRFRERVRVARRNLKGKFAGIDLPLHPAARFALGRWLATLRSRGVKLTSDMPIFLSREGGVRSLSRRRAQEIVQEAASRAGLGFGVSTHSWRKTFAGRLYEATGHNILLVSRALHHRQLSTSIHYLTWKLNEKADAAILAL